MLKQRQIFRYRYFTEVLESADMILILEAKNYTKDLQMRFKKEGFNALNKFKNRTFSCLAPSGTVPYPLVQQNVLMIKPFKFEVFEDFEGISSFLEEDLIYFKWGDLLYNKELVAYLGLGRTEHCGSCNSTLQKPIFGFQFAYDIPVVSFLEACSLIG